MGGACFNPGPVEEGEGAGYGKGLGRGDGPWRGEEEEVCNEQDAGDGVETEVGGQGQLGPVRDDEALVDEAEGPVENADEDFERGGADGEGVFEEEEGGGGGQVGEEAGGEGEEGEGQADDGEELEVPAVGGVDGVGVVGEVFEGGEEGGEADDVDEGGEGSEGGGGKALERMLMSHVFSFDVLVCVGVMFGCRQVVYSV